MTSKELTDKIMNGVKTLTDDEWLDLYEKAMELDDLKIFRETLAGNILGQMACFARLHKEKEKDNYQIF